MECFSCGEALVQDVNHVCGEKGLKSRIAELVEEKTRQRQENYSKGYVNSSPKGFTCPVCKERVPFDTNTVNHTCVREAKEDAVNHPAHYTSHPSGIECIEITEHMNFCLGNAVKYLWRASLKGKQTEDLEKARFYIDREIERLSNV